MKVRHVVETHTKTWFHLDDNNLVYNCDCMKPIDEQVELCLSICPHLKAEGELRVVEREIAQRRKELGMLQSVKIEDIQKFMEGGKM